MRRARSGRLRRHIAFSGMKDGYTDIYVWDLEKKTLRRLTADIAHDDKPSFSPSGKWIAFESDRPAAAMPPGSETFDASAIARPRTAESCRTSAGSSTPAAISAVYSP